jgi:hypothetical protein
MRTERSRLLVLLRNGNMRDDHRRRLIALSKNALSISLSFAATTSTWAVRLGLRRRSPERFKCDVVARA